jgi:hypothetical protein
MKIVPLQKVVNEYSIDEVVVSKEKPFPVISETYQIVKTWFIKGEWKTYFNMLTHKNTLYVQALEKDSVVSIERPLEAPKETILEKTSEVSSIPKLLPDETIRDIFYVRILHFPSKSLSKMKICMKKDIAEFVSNSIKTFEEVYKQPVNKKDFAIVRVGVIEKEISLSIDVEGVE